MGYLFRIAGCTVFAAVTFAQTSGTIAGVLRFAPDRAAAGAVAVAENLSTGQTWRTQADDDGRVVFPALPVGDYAVRAELEGFEPVLYRRVTLHAAETVELDFEMRPAVLRTSVTVVERVPAPELAGVAAGNRIESAEIASLPINGRDYARFSLLSPGAVGRGNFIADLSFNGLHTVHNQFAIDGVDASRVDQPYMANGYERGARLLTGSLDTIAEFRVESGVYRAEFGRAAGSVINIVTRSGGNRLHGTIFEHLRNSVLDARNFFAPAGPKPAFRLNTFGGSFSGPLRREKTFWSATYEGSRQRIGVTAGGTVPSEALRAEVRKTSPALSEIVDLYPRGSSATGNPLVDLYSVVRSSRVREDTGSVRIDHRVSNRDSFFFRANVNDSRVSGPLFAVTPAAMGLLDKQNVPVRTANLAFEHQHVFSARFLNTLLAGVQRWGSQIDTAQPFPLTSVTGLTAAPGTRGWSLQNADSAQLGDSMTLVRGRHTLKWGATLWRVRVNRRTLPTTSMSFTSLDDFIRNRIASVTATPADPGHGTLATQAGAYAQDSLRLGPVSLDFGLRYDFETVPRDLYRATRPFDPRAGALAASGAPYFRGNRRNFAPRLGLAWRARPRLTARAGYGVFWQMYPISVAAINVPRNTLPGNTTVVRQQAPDLAFPFDAFLARGTTALPTAAGFDWDRRDIYAQHWDFSLTFDAGRDTLVQASYVGSHALNLRRNMNINFFEPALGRRPIAGFGDVSLETNTGRSIYHALQVALRRRMSRRIQAGVNYTFGHAIDDVQDQGIGSAQPQDNRNLRAERGHAAVDARHNLSFNLLLELGGGWKIASLGLVRGGLPNTVLIGSNTFGNANLTNQRPDAVAGESPYPPQRTIANWFNSASFRLPARGTFGNLGRNTVRGPSFAQADFSVLKDFAVREGKTLQFRAEFYNLPNHPIFEQPNAVFGGASFGRVLNTFGKTVGAGTPRQVQLVLRFGF